MSRLTVVELDSLPPEIAAEARQYAQHAAKRQGFCFTLAYSNGITIDIGPGDAIVAMRAETPRFYCSDDDDDDDHDAAAADADVEMATDSQ
jgi:hypothetical protein